MSRLIDADALMTRFINGQCYYASTIRSKIETAPTVDAVDVVRCKDCRWYDGVDWCNKLRISGIKEFKETWFCAGGERKEDAGV